jgi:hypothetical protein
LRPGRVQMLAKYGGDGYKNVRNFYASELAEPVYRSRRGLFLCGFGCCGIARGDQPDDVRVDLFLDPSVTAETELDWLRKATGLDQPPAVCR